MRQLADNVSQVLEGAQIQAQRAGSPVVELEHLRIELAAHRPIVFNAALAKLGLPPETGQFKGAEGPEFFRGARRSALPGSFQVRASSYALHTSQEVADLVDLVDSIDELCDRVAKRLADVTVPSKPPAEPVPDPVRSPVQTKDWHDGALDLTSLAESHHLDPLIGREDELRHLARILLRRRKRNALLVGPPGVGKTALVEGLAQRIASGDVPDAMKSWRVLSLNVPKLLAGTSFRGDFEARMDGLLQQAVASDETHVLFIDEFDLVITAGAAKGGVEAAAILKPYMARGEVVVIGACTQQDLSDKIMSDPALRRRMAVVSIEELDLEATTNVLRGMRPLMEEHHGVTIPDETVERCVSLVGANSHGHRPDNALELLDDACAHAVLGSDETPVQVMPDHVEAVNPDA